MNQARTEVLMTDEKWDQFTKFAKERAAVIISQASIDEIKQGNASLTALMDAAVMEMQTYEVAFELLRRIIFGVTCDDPECDCHAYGNLYASVADAPSTNKPATVPTPKPETHKTNHHVPTMVIPNKKEVV